MGFILVFVKNKNITQTMVACSKYMCRLTHPVHVFILEKTFCPLSCLKSLIRLASWLSHAKPSSKSRHQTQSQSKDVGKQ